MLQYKASNPTNGAQPQGRKSKDISHREQLPRGKNSQQNNKTQKESSTKTNRLAGRRERKILHLLGGPQLRVILLDGLLRQLIIGGLVALILGALVLGTDIAKAPDLIDQALLALGDEHQVGLIDWLKVSGVEGFDRALLKERKQVLVGSIFSSSDVSLIVSVSLSDPRIS